MKKLNILKLSFASVLMLCFMSIAFVCTGMKANAAVPTEAGKAATFTVNSEGNLVLDAESKYMTAELMVRVPSTGVTINDGKLAKGGRYLFINGICTPGNKITESFKVVPTVEFGKTIYYKEKAYKAGSAAPAKDNYVFNTYYAYYTGTNLGKMYVDGDAYDGYYFDSDQNILYKFTNGIGNKDACNGVIQPAKYFDKRTNKLVNTPKGGFYVAKGVMQSGFAGLNYYTNGFLATNKTGWSKISGNIYYFKAGTAVTGWNWLASYGKGVKKYKYLFSKDGVLYTNLVNYYGYNKFIQKDIKIITNKTTHNTTFYLKDSKGNFSIPALTVVCATARKKNDTPKGTYRLEKTWNKRWFVYTKTNGAPYRYYQWAVHIKGTPTLYHSSTYRKTSAASLRSDLYNKLGTSCTTHCIRLQARYAKMIYDIATKTNKKRRVPVQIITSKNEGPFGHVSLQKIKSGTKWDPTDPNKK